jgi:predicted transposase YbfD/YdcC
VSQKINNGKVTATYAETQECSHGRFEYRRAVVVPAEELKDKYDFSGFSAIARVDDTRELNGKTETRTRLFAMSKEFTSERTLKIVRSQWSIENKCHWVLDVTFNEDHSRTRKDNGPQNLSLIRRLVMNLWRAVPYKGSVAVKRKRAGWNNTCFLELITHLR